KSVRLGVFTLEIEGFNHSGRAILGGEILNDNDVVPFDTIILDNTNPEVLDMFPPGGSTNLPLNTIMQITFSEPVKASTVNTGNIRLASGQGNVSGSVVLSTDKKTVTFAPASPLQSFRLYTLSVYTGVSDRQGNPLNAAASTSFSTTDIEAPTIISISPAQNSIQAAPQTAVVVTFNEPLNVSYFSWANLAVKRVSDNTSVPGTLSFNENNTRVTFTPAQLLAENALYTVSVTGARDLAGNTQTSVWSANFTTIDTINPTLTLRTDPAGLVSVKEGSQIKLVGDTGSSTDVSKVFFFVDSEHRHTDSSPAFSYQFPAPLKANGKTSFLVEALAEDHVGNQGSKPHLII
ncbi:MAG: Ig-like domain-containing protein, partial [bacterium]|nr:Ig-like domain-containing protein [bacterium]